MSEWREATIGEFITLQRGFDITRSQQQVGEVPVVSSGGISSYHNVAMAKAPGVVIGRKGTLGKVFYLDKDYWPHDTTLWVKDFKGNLPRFVYYYLQTMNLVRHDVGSSNPTLNRNHVHPLSTFWPPLRAQVAIAGLLEALDDKVAVNERISCTADTLRSSLLYRDLALHGVNLTPLSSLAEFTNGKAFTKNATGMGRMVIRIAELNSGPGVSTVYNDIEVPTEHLARAGDVLFAWSGSLTVVRWYRPESIVNQHIFKVTPRLGIPPWLIFDVINNEMGRFRSIAADKVTTMGHIQRRHLDVAVAVPDHSRISMLDGELSLLWHRALRAEEEMLTLIEIRDTLLPKLVSGKLRIKDAERQVEDVV